ncbi:MAG: C40 family peptidase [Ginsengibacter sp.]
MKIFTFLLVFAFAIFTFYVFTHKTANDLSEEKNNPQIKSLSEPDSALIAGGKTLVIKDSLPIVKIVTKKAHPDSLVAYAESLIGTPYKYGSADPSVGFDCSGFITYVFNHYNIDVPRSSKDFENSGVEIPMSKCKKGDLILFTGTDSTERIIGHMGIVVSNNTDGLKFIHSTSGKLYGVVITDFNKYYQGRFVKTIRVFN